MRKQLTLDDLDKLKQVKQEIQTEGFNEGIRAAANLALTCWDWGTAQRKQAEKTSRAILKLIKH